MYKPAELIRQITGAQIRRDYDTIIVSQNGHVLGTIVCKTPANSLASSAQSAFSLEAALHVLLTDSQNPIYLRARSEMIRALEEYIRVRMLAIENITDRKERKLRHEDS
jgi:hypothetical protein